MNKLALLTFMLTFNAWSTGYLIYPKQVGPVKKGLQSINIEAVDVFSSHEKILYKSYDLPIDVLRFESSKSLKEIKMALDGLEYQIEINESATFQSDIYSSTQWALDNTGSPLQVRTSDIDVREIPGVAGEDIGIANFLESDKKILVAIIDSGVDLNHPDLKDNIYRNENECKALHEFNQCMKNERNKDICYRKYSNHDSDRNGHPLDCNGWNVLGKPLKFSKAQGNHAIVDRIGHGTHIAGILGAIRDNGIGIKGVLKNIAILPVQISGEINQRDLAANETTIDLIAKGVLYAIKTKAQVINISLGWALNEDSMLMRKVVELAKKEKILVVAAAGNSSHADPTYPCSYDYVICAGSHNVNGKLSDFSNYGTSVDLFAPGDNILSTWPTTMRPIRFTEGVGYEYQDGTSFAAPYIAASAAALLNAGIAPDRVFATLLSGTRKNNSKTNFARHGNVDISSALAKNVRSFIYPLNKSPYLIQWKLGEQRSFLLKLTNYGDIAKDVSLAVEPAYNFSDNSIEIIDGNFQVEEWKENEEKTFKVTFNSNDDIDSDIYFKLRVKSSDESKDYFLHAQALTIITPDYVGESEHVAISNGDFLKGASLRTFDNYDKNFAMNDFFAMKKDQGKTFIAIVKNSNNEYKASKAIEFPIASPVFLHVARVDIDQDGKSEYVLAAVDVMEQADNNIRKTHFYIYDENLNKLPIVITPGNVFDNKITVMPGSFQWIKMNGRMTPAWINMGEQPAHELPPSSPWEPAQMNLKFYRVFYLSPKNIHTFPMKSEESTAISFLETPAHKRHYGMPLVVMAEGHGFVKKYQIYQVAGKLKLLGNLMLQTYQDLYGLRPLPLATASDSYSAFFNAFNSMGAQRITTIEFQDKRIKSEHIKLESFDENLPIHKVLGVFNSGIFYQTQYHIAFYDKRSKNHLRVPSKVKPIRMVHQVIGNQSALYLAAAHTPSLSSEVISIKEDENKVYRSSLWRMLGAKSCEAIGFVNESFKNYLFFHCSESSKFIKLKY